MVAQEKERRQVDLAPLDVTEQARKAFYQTSGLDTPHRFALAHAETPLTEVKERRARRSKIEPPCFDLDEMQEQTTEETARLEAHRRQAGEELFVREIRECHVAFLHLRFSRSSAPLGHAIDVAIASRSDPSVRRRLDANAGRGAAVTSSPARACSMPPGNASTEKCTVILIRHRVLYAAKKSPALAGRFVREVRGRLEIAIDPLLVVAIVEHDFTTNRRAWSRGGTC